jgi:hypothetical protein
VSQLHGDLNSFGLVVIGAHTQKGTTEEIQATARSRGVTFTVVSSASVKDGQDFNGIPHCMVFDHAGQCIYRGSPEGAEASARKAVGIALVEDVGKSTFSKPLMPLVESLKKGQSPKTILQKVLPLQRSPDANAASEAKQLVTSLSKTGQKQIEAAEVIKKEDPYAAYVSLQKVPLTFKGTPVETKANAVLAELRRNKVVAVELQAHASFDKIKKWDTALSAAAGKVDPKGPEFQRAFRSTLKQMQTTLQQMKRSWPDSKATREAIEIGEKYAVMVP